MTDVTVRALGTIVVTGASLPRAHQQRVLLAVLIGSAPGAVAASRLAEALWPESLPGDWRKPLQVLVARLRKALAPAGIGIDFDPGGYALRVDSSSIDLIRFRHLLEDARSLPGERLDEVRQVFESALGLWRGEPFEGLDVELLDAVRSELRLRRDEATARLHQVRLDLGEATTLLPEVVTWARERPLDEAAWCRLALALFAAGRPSEAVRALQEHRTAVRSIGLAPTAAFAEVESKLLAEGPQPAGVGQRGNLRVPSSKLFGRASAIEQVALLLTPDLVTTLVGVGGIGKTVLALHVAEAVRSRHRDGLWFCELAEIDTGDAIVDAIAGVLGVHQQRGRSLLSSIIDGFANAEALLVIDNCEHVLPAATEVIDVLRRGCPKVTVLATSREPLGMSWEQVVRVDALPVAAPGEVDSGPAAALFVDRATAAGATPACDVETFRAVADICKSLDGLPLAIELAAVRVRSMSPIEMSHRLDERFRLLRRRHPDGPKRQQTLWDTIDWSYRLLDHDGRRFFAQLSVFLGGLTVEAAAAVAGRPVQEVEEALWDLADRSLLTVEPARAETRFQVLETLRQFGVVQLRNAGLVEATRQAHLEYFVGFAERARQWLRGPNEAGAVVRVGRDLANLRAAHQYAVGSGCASLGARLVAALHEYAEWRQFFELGTWAQATLALGDPAELAPTLHAIAGWGHCIAGEYDAAARDAQLGLVAEGREGVECGWLHDVLAHCAFFQQEQAAGLRHGDAEIARARAAGDDYRLSYVLADNGTHLGLGGDLDRGLERALEGLALAQRTGNPAVVSMAQLALGFAHRDREPATAIDWYRRAAALADTVESHWTSGVCRGELAVLLALHGDPHEAVGLVHAQLQRFRRAGDAARTRGMVRSSIPALRRLLDAEHWPTLVTLDAATADRPQINEPFNERAIASVLEGITSHLRPDVMRHATSIGRSMDDLTAFELAESTMELGLMQAPSRCRIAENATSDCNGVAVAADDE